MNLQTGFGFGEGCMLRAVPLLPLNIKAEDYRGGLSGAATGTRRSEKQERSGAEMCVRMHLSAE